MNAALSLVKIVLLLPAFAYATLWGTLALWYQLPGPAFSVALTSAIFAAFGVSATLSIFRPSGRRPFILFGTALAAVLLFWISLTPPKDGDWSPEVARQVTGVIDGDTLTLTNFRDFEWRTDEDVTERWTTRSFDLSQIETVDLFMSYWAGPSMAHLIISFGFADGQYLSWSVEVRRSQGETFSPVADFFKSNPVSIIASTEKDVVGLRSNIQRANVHLFRLDIAPADQRIFLEEYVRAANEIDRSPIFFNSFFTNCSMSVLKLVNRVGANLPLDWRVYVNGYLPEYLYDLGRLNTNESIETLYRLGDITERARAHGLTDGFSEAIRVGVPSP